MSSACNNGVTSDYKPGTWNLTGLKVGYSYAAKHTFTGDGVDISADTFQVVVKNSAGTTIATLGIGTGLTIESDTVLGILIESPITDAAGTYSMTASRSEALTGASYPYATGKIVVSP